MPRTGAEKPCQFCSIIAEPSNASVVYSDETCICFLDIHPLFPGHCLLVPREHLQTLPEVPKEIVGPLFATAQRICRAVQAAMNGQGTFVAMNNTVSQSVPHLHIHIVPRTKGDGLKGFFWPRTKYRDDAHREEVRSAIAEALALD